MILTTYYNVNKEIVFGILFSNNRDLYNMVYFMGKEEFIKYTSYLDSHRNIVFKINFKSFLLRMKNTIISSLLFLKWYRKCKEKI